MRLGLEAATLDATVSGLPGDVRAEQISFWRQDIADGLIADGIKPEDAEREASLVKATFTGLVLDLLATGHRKRLTDALECALSRLDGLRQTPREGGRRQTQRHTTAKSSGTTRCLRDLATAPFPAAQIGGYRTAAIPPVTMRDRDSRHRQSAVSRLRWWRWPPVRTQSGQRK